MTLNPPTLTTRHMSLRQRWNQTSLANKFAVATSIIAILITLFGLGVTINFSKKQTNLDAAVATFQVQVQTTADHQYSQQFNIQQTQIAMQLQMDTWARQQALPFVKVIVPPEHIFTVEEIKSEQTNSGYMIKGIGTLNLLLANNGGGRAGLIGIEWVKKAGQAENLFVQVNKFSNEAGITPNTIEAQTPIRIQLGLEASVPYSGDPTNKSDYQLGEYWKKAIQSNPNHLAVNFSNADTINIEIEDIQLAMPVVSYEPNPTSLFLVTNKTPLIVRCFKTGGESIQLSITYLNENQTIQTVAKDEACNSFPEGTYQIVWTEPDSNSSGGIREITINPQTPSLIDLSSTKENKDLWSTNASVMALVLTAFASILFGLVKRGERGVLELYTTNHVDSLPTIVFSKSIRILPWGSKTKMHFRNETITIKINKKDKDKYVTKILRSSRHTGYAENITRELSLRDDAPVRIGAGLDGELEILIRKIDNE